MRTGAAVRLKFMLDGGHRMVDVVDYSFRTSPSPTVSFERKEGKTETVEITGDVFVMNDKGDTIDRLYPRKER